MSLKQSLGPCKTNILNEGIVRFSLLGQGAAAPLRSTAANKVIAASGDITRSGAGLYAVVLSTAGKTLLSAQARIRTASATVTAQQVVNCNWTASTRTLDVRVVGMANPPAYQDVASNDIIELDLVFTESATP